MSGNEPLENVDNQEEIDPWEAAFAKLAEKDAPSPAGTEESAPDPEPDGGQEPEPEGEPGGGGDAGEPDPGVPPAPPIPPGQAGAEPEPTGEPEAELPEVAEYQKEARQFAINYVREEFKKQGVPVDPDGMLGLTPDHQSICKKDADGVKHYYNPENGREFTGPNPRRDAQDYCDQYNTELAKNFNKACKNVEDQRLKESEPTIKMLKFEKTYDTMDDVTRELFDDIIEDYEIHDKSGDLIGYSIDLDKAHSAAKRQAARVAKWRTTEPDPKAPTGPETDMKKGSAKGEGKPKRKIDSLEAALEAMQDELMEKGRK